MSYIDQITKENFISKFNIQEILNQSVYYPASGIDASDIECLGNKFNSFIHVDYSYKKKDVYEAMTKHFKPVGYELIGIKEVLQTELTPNGIQLNDIVFNKHEKERLKQNFIKTKFNKLNFKPFAYWAVYQLNSNFTNKLTDKTSQFSLLHIGNEACATFEVLYITHKINPSAIVIIDPSEGYGDNWTLFTNPNFRFYKSISSNSIKNNIHLPRIRLTNINSREDTFFWPNYKFLNECKLNLNKIYTIENNTENDF